MSVWYIRNGANFKVGKVRPPFEGHRRGKRTKRPNSEHSSNSGGKCSFWKVGRWAGGAIK